jgi:hypothetical protein
MACNLGASLYEPINVYKPVAPDIGIVDGPFEYLTVGGAKLPLPFTTRMTAVRGAGFCALSRAGVHEGVTVRSRWAGNFCRTAGASKLDRLARSTRDLLNTLAATAQYPFANFVRKILEVFIRDF